MEDKEERGTSFVQAHTYTCTHDYMCAHTGAHMHTERQRMCSRDLPRFPAAVEWRACPPVTSKQLDLLSVRDLGSCGHTEPVFASSLAVTARLILAA